MRVTVAPVDPTPPSGLLGPLHAQGAHKFTEINTVDLFLKHKRNENTSKPVSGILLYTQHSDGWGMKIAVSGYMAIVHINKLIQLMTELPDT